MAQFIFPPDRYAKLKGFSSVAPGNIAYCDMDVDRDYSRVILRASATGKTDFADIIDEVRVVVNGVSIRTLSPYEIRMMNAINGSAYNDVPANSLVINFREDHLWDTHGADTLMLFATGLRSFRIECKVKTGITSPQLWGEYAYLPPTPGIKPTQNVVRHTKTVDLTFGAAGELPFRNQPFFGVVRRLLIYGSLVTAIKFRKGETDYIQEMDRQSNTDWLKVNGLVPQTNVMVLPFDLTQRSTDGERAQALFDANGTMLDPGLTNSELRITTNAGGNVRYVAEYFARIPD